jgi:hypothetical protein
MSFGSFYPICSQVALPLCALVEDKTEPLCYARNIEPVPNSLLFQPAALVINLTAIIMNIIMIAHVRTKYTAVGRKEILMFFYLYFLVVLLEIALLTGWMPVSSAAYPWTVAIHLGLVSSTLWCLFVNGFVGFQWVEDGTRQSLYILRISSLVIFGIVFLVSISTFNSYIGLSPHNTVALFIVYFLFNGLLVVVYSLMQIFLVLNTLDDRWPLGGILFGLVFFLVGQVFEYTLSFSVCKSTSHYIDGTFFGTVCSLLGVMMIYKYWDSITKEDLEFSVAGKTNVWELPSENEPLKKDF